MDQAVVRFFRSLTSWWLILFLGAGMIVSAVFGLVNISRDKALKPPPATANAPFLRFYVDSKSAIPPLSVNIELGQTGGTYSAASGTTLHVSLKSVPSGQASPTIPAFNWKIALLCVPGNTSAAAGIDVLSPAKAVLTGPNLKDCPVPADNSGLMITGRWDPSHQRPVPAPVTSDLSSDMSGLANFTLPPNFNMVTTSGDEIRATFPYVSSENICDLPPQPELPGGAAAKAVDNGPGYTTGELAGKICGAVPSLTVTKTLDVTQDIVNSDNQQTPAASAVMLTQRDGFAWDEDLGNPIVLVQTISLSEQESSHVAEVWGAVLLGIAAAALIAFLQEFHNHFTERNDWSPSITPG
jgi:hypothetical protein